MQSILQAIKALPTYQQVLRDIQAGQSQPGLGLPRSARLPFLSLLHADIRVPILFVTDRADHALALSDELGFWVKDASRILFPEPNPLFYENATWGSATRRDRLQALTMLLGIDMGAVDLVIQVESPRSVARGLQRIGRSGHQVGGVSAGRLSQSTGGTCSNARSWSGEWSKG